jgi:threonine aldolase
VDVRELKQSADKRTFGGRYTEDSFPRIHGSPVRPRVAIPGQLAFPISPLPSDTFGLLVRISRRNLVQTIGATAGVALLGKSTAAAASDPEAVSRTVHLSGDGIPLSPRQFASLLGRLCAERDIAVDDYLLGGEIESFERHWAALLGKERAIFMPSGTLANQLALRELAGPKRRVLVPEVSHVYNDTGDACQTLSGLTLLPLAAGAATFTRADVEAALARTAGGRVATGIGAILIESPIRRLTGRLFDWEEAKHITAFARENGIGTHLDGARLFIASAYTGVSPADYAAPFDMVYVSLWKYFNSGIGAILAGSEALLDGMFHVRRMFGGNLYHGWQAAVVARHYMDGFPARLTAAVKVSEDFYAAIGQDSRVRVERIPDGTNLAHVRLKDIDVSVVAKRLSAQNIAMPTNADAGALTFRVNETWGRTTGAELARAFKQAIG